jgi:hypothetical protein
MNEALTWWKNLGSNPLMIMINQGELVTKHFNQFKKVSSLTDEDILKIYKLENVKRYKIHVNGFEYWRDISNPNRIMFYDSETFKNGISIEDTAWTKDEKRQLKELLKEKFNINYLGF